MPIVYDVPSNTITVTGYTELAPCTFLDIFNADVAGGWGVFTRQCDRQYCSRAKIQIGDGIIASWFADLMEQLIGKDYTAVNNDEFIKVMNNAHFRLGEVLNATEKSTRKGCSILLDCGTVYHKRMIWVLTGGEGLLYSSHFTCDYPRFIIGYTGKLIIWNCLLDYYGVITGGNANSDVFNVISTNPDVGLNNWLGTCNRLTILSSVYCDIYNWGATGGVYRNIYARLATNFFIRVPSITVDTYVIDADTDTWSVLFSGVCTAEVYRQYTFNLLVTEEDGTAINNCTVELLNNVGAVVFSVATAADGTIAEQTVSRGYYDQAHGNVLQDYGPFTLRIYTQDYRIYIHSGIVLDEPIDWRIRLSKRAWA